VPRIDPSSRVADGARLADDVEIGPFCTIGANVDLRAGVRLLSHVNLSGVTVIGERTVIYPFASLGTPPQSVKYKGGPTRLLIGPNCEIREHVTMNTGTEEAGGLTEIGARCLFMVGAHVGHDCHVGNDVTFANNATLGGHVIVGDSVFFGGLSAVHQFARIGEGAMIAGVTGVPGETGEAPLALALRATPNPSIAATRLAFDLPTKGRVTLGRANKELFGGPGTFPERLEEAVRKYAGDPVVGKVISFIQEGSPRALLQPARSFIVETESSQA